MSKNVAMFVDVANMYYAARGQDVDVDYVALLKHATKGRDLIRAYAYTGLDPENENQRKFIDFLGKNGYKPVVKDIRKFGDGRMKANLDIELVVDLFRLADRMDIAVIVSGDGDFAPAIRALQDKGVRAEVISFKPNTSSDLIAVADEFTDIMKIASIGRGKGMTASRTSMGAPEMPAKEVSPEFGFREASPSVAAAALAAIKTGAPAGNGRRARGGTRRAAPETAEGAAEAPAAAPVATIAADGEETKRRRRRRGGRGRGRSRRPDGEPAGDSAAPAAPDAAIGWEEFDDVTQIDRGDDPDREYTFDEADAATLAELGIAPPAEDDDAAKPAPRSRTRRAAAEPQPEQGDAPKRRGRTAKEPADDGAAAPKPRTRARKTETADDEPTAAAPPKRSRPRAKAAEPTSTDEAAAESAGSEEPQGIWGRFRSARRPTRTTPTS